MFGLVFGIVSRLTRAGGAPPPASFVLMEAGTFFLLEDGVSKIQLEV